MLERIKYVNNNGEVLEFGEKGIYANENDLRDYTWVYDADRNKVENFRRTVTKKGIPIVIKADTEEDGKNIKNNMFEVFEQDVLLEKPGKLWIGDYYLECYIVENSKSNYLNDKKIMNTSIKIAADTGAWIKETKIPFQYDDQDKDTSGKCYPHNYPYNYGLGGGYNSSISVEAFGSMDFIITIYGYAHNPEICIGENTYKVDYTVQSGEVLRIDSKNHSVLLTKTNGVTLSLFRYRGIRSYIFEKIISGELPVYWNGDFDWDILLLEERSEPKWT